MKQARIFLAPPNCPQPNGWSITEHEVMHNADNLLECDRCLASTIVTAERIAVPRKTAADNASTPVRRSLPETNVPQRQLVVSGPKKCLAMHVGAQTSLFQRIDFAAHKHLSSLRR
jgi:hypothetical protein